MYAASRLAGVEKRSVICGLAEVEQSICGLSDGWRDRGRIWS